MEKKPQVTVIINCLNGERYLNEAIESVYRQSHQDWEIVLYDNCSTDRTPEIAAEYDERVRYHRSESTVPLGAARNKALKFARGEFIAFLDADDIWMPNKLASQMALFVDEDVGIVYGDVESFNEAGRRRRLSKRKSFARGECFESLLVGYFLSMSSVVIRTRALAEQHVYFRDGFQMVEEMDLFIRIAYRWKLDFVPDVLSRWRVHSESVTWKRYDLLADESELMLKMLADDIPDFESRYRHTIVKARAVSSRMRATYLWMSGQSGAARIEIRRAPTLTLDLIALWLVSFIPARSALPLVFRLRSSVVYPSK
jgi:glycosyltransferase involved in cell wall biosynthesis